MTLKNPPIALAVFQIKFQEQISSTDILKPFVKEIQKELPILMENISGSVKIEGTPVLGVSTVKATTDNKLKSYTLCSKDQKIKLELGIDFITYNDENKYLGWDSFTASILKYLAIIEPLLTSRVLSRVSLRTINKFDLAKFDNPTEYFKTTIVSTESSGFIYPIADYGFKLRLQIPNTQIHSIIHHNVEQIDSMRYLYILDIDVVDKVSLIYSEGAVSQSLDRIRPVKNNIFLNSITQNTIDLCN